MYAYAHTPLDEETIKLTGFSSGDKLYAFIRGFYGLKGLPNFFTKQMSIRPRIYILKIEEPRVLPFLILILHRILKEDFIILHSHIYQLILCIKRIQIQILTLILTHYHQIQSNIYLHHSHNN